MTVRLKRLTCAVKEVPADLETPVSAFIKLRALGARFLLESVEQGERIGRYSFIGIGALKTFRVLKDYYVVEEGGKVDVRPISGDPLASLRQILSEYEIERPATALPELIGGAVGYVGYDYARFLERLPDRTPDPLEIPICNFFITGTFVVFDHFSRKILVVALGERSDSGAIDRILAALDQPLPREVTHPSPVAARHEWKSPFARESFLKGVERIKEYIAAGDIFQCVLSRRLSAEVGVDSFQIYRALRILNPSPYMFYLDFGEYKLVGSSPEVHVKLNGGQALCRPIAGTRPRGGNEEEDAKRAQELLANEKERAEHLMLVDLARNDLGRVCRPGTVVVRDFMVVERYSHVMHLVSEAVGTLDQGQDQFDLLSKTFPAGTVSGAPKIRAMEIIEELEPVRRAHYAGTVGYLSLTGECNMAITIRTMLIKGGTIHLQAGAGIVHDSDPEFEFEESMHKMKALQEAVDLAARGLK
jgi:anthranilate synthase component 1